MRGQRVIDRQHRVAIAFRADDDRADLRLVDAQPQQRIVELAERAQRPELIAGGEDLLDRLRVAVGRPAGNEERRGQRVLAQQLEDPRDADERPVCLMLHDAEVARVQPALREDRRLRVDVERQAREDAHRAKCSVVDTRG